MPRGQRDYGLYAPTEVAASISDMGEVAARLGSIIIYDRRGMVVDYDNFEDPLLKWDRLTGVAGDYVRHDSFNARSGSQSVKLLTIADVDGEAGIEKSFQVLRATRLGFEYSFCSLSSGQYLDIEIDIYDGVRKHDVGVRIDNAALTPAIWLWDDTGAWKRVIEVTWQLEDVDWLFHTLKFVVDFSTDHYIRLMFNRDEYDISTELCQSVLNPGIPLVLARIIMKNKAAAGSEMWLEDFILTQEEP